MMWIAPIVIGVLFGGVIFLFAMIVEGFNPNVSGRLGNAVGLGVLMGIAAVLVVRGLEWVIVRR